MEKNLTWKTATDEAEPQDYENTSCQPKSYARDINIVIVTLIN